MSLTEEDAYRYCAERVSRHYENFPVASLLLPKRLRQPISVIYAFARTADDFADEGDLTDQQRLAALSDYRGKLNRCARGESMDDPVFVALADAITRWQLPVQLLDDLITAFEMDVTKKRFVQHEEVLHYCRYSANPVGRLLLHLFGEAT
ncbi:MAG: squalene/phytoene synthase family protein, partial [Gammaproteobacteria bacterium]|nr:squalene/phytoene synthase family protein [Gammaproteobacteria bacterium]